MRITIFTALLLLPLLSTATKADVKINLEEGITVLAANGKEISSDKLFSEAKDVVLPDGLNQLAIQYTAEIPVSSDDYTIEKSKVFIVTFNANNTTVIIKEPAIKSENHLDRFNKNMNWTLLDKNNNKIDYKIDTLNKSGFQLIRNYERELEEFNQSNSPAALVTSAINSSNNSNAGINRNNPVSTKKNMAADMLRFWYDQADAETRADFLRWITTK